MAEYSSHSPYYSTLQTTWNLGHYQHRSIPVDANDSLILVEAKYEHRPDLLSYDLYGTPELWWVFAVRNMDTIMDPIYDLVSGLEIYAPSKNAISSLLF